MTLARLEPLVVAALDRTGAVLSEMSGVHIELKTAALRLLPLTHVPAAAGDAETPAVVVYVAMIGEGQGHVLLLMNVDVALRLAGALLFEDPASISLSDELPASALAEAGNVSCSAFMNSLGDATGLLLEVTPPAVLEDMRGAIVDAVVADIALLGDQALVIDTHFNIASETEILPLQLLVIPSPTTLERLLERAEATPEAA